MSDENKPRSSPNTSFKDDKLQYNIQGINESNVSKFPEILLIGIAYLEL